MWFIFFRGVMSSFIESLPKGDLSWKNFDPVSVIEESGTFLDVKVVLNTFNRVRVKFQGKFDFCSESWTEQEQNAGQPSHR